jgi:hypothetical protein
LCLHLYKWSICYFLPSRSQSTTTTPTTCITDEHFYPLHPPTPKSNGKVLFFFSQEPGARSQEPARIPWRCYSVLLVSGFLSLPTESIQPQGGRACVKFNETSGTKKRESLTHTHRRKTWLYIRRSTHFHAATCMKIRSSVCTCVTRLFIANLTDFRPPPFFHGGIKQSIWDKTKS